MRAICFAPRRKSQSRLEITWMCLKAPAARYRPRELSASVRNRKKRDPVLRKEASQIARKQNAVAPSAPPVVFYVYIIVAKPEDANFFCSPDRKNARFAPRRTWGVELSSTVGFPPLAFPALFHLLSFRSQRTARKASLQAAPRRRPGANFA